MRLVHLLFSLVFCLLISVPLTLKVINYSPKPLDILEKRALNSFPDLEDTSFARWPKVLEGWLNDTLPFRTYFISNYMRIWEMELGALVRSYLLGKNGDLFPDMKIASSVHCYLGLQPLSQKELAELKLAYAGTQAMCLLHGAAYLLVHIPDKTSLYPELLPAWTQIARGPSWREQVIQTLGDSSINFLDLKPLLEEYKPYHRLYPQRYDPWHWNAVALAATYDIIAKRLGEIQESFLPESHGVYYSLRSKNIGCGPFGNENIPWMKILATEYLEIKNKPSILDYKKFGGWTNADILINKRKDKLTLLFATDSYFKSLGFVDPVPGASGTIFPLAHHVHKYIHIHYGVLNWSTLNFIYNEHRPDIMVEAFIERGGSVPERIRDPYIRILGDIFLKTPSYILANREGFPEDVQVLNGKLSAKMGKVTLEAEANSRITLPSLNTDANGRAAVMLRLEAPENTEAKLFFAQKDPDFHQENYISTPIKKGENVLHLSVYTTNPGEKIYLGFSPGSAPGVYTFLPIPELDQLKKLMKETVKIP